MPPKVSKARGMRKPSSFKNPVFHVTGKTGRRAKDGSGDFIVTGKTGHYEEGPVRKKKKK